MCLFTSEIASSLGAAGKPGHPAPGGGSSLLQAGHFLVCIHKLELWTINLYEGEKG